MIEITPQLIFEVIKKWRADHIAHMESYGLSISIESHIDDLIDKFCERLEVDRDKLYDD